MSEAACQQLEFRLTKIHEHAWNLKSLTSQIKEDLTELRTTLERPVQSTRDSTQGPFHSGSTETLSPPAAVGPQLSEKHASTVPETKPIEASQSTQPPRLGQGWGADIELDDLL